MRKYWLPLTYPPKIEPVIRGECTRRSDRERNIRSVMKSPSMDGPGKPIVPPGHSGHRIINSGMFRISSHTRLAGRSRYQNIHTPIYSVE